DDEAFAALPVDVRMLGGVATGTRALRRQLPPPGWCSMAGSGMSTREFLHHLDVFVYQGPWDVAAHIAALEAMSAELPAVLPLAARDTFRHAAAYAAPAEVEGTLARLVAEPDVRNDLIRRGRQFVRSSSEPWGALFEVLSRNAT
ncbi:MAG: hypothetical protein WA962_13200, partial [Ornithinimicrobium sp.]